MEIFASFSQDGVIDGFTCMLGERNPLTGSDVILAAAHGARVFAQCTEETYDPNGDSEHVGRPVNSSGRRLVE